MTTAHNPFEDQHKFMVAGDQSVGEYNRSQYEMYKNLIKEEYSELFDDAETMVDELDALIDILVVTIGAIHSMGVDPQAAWDEVMRTNFAKIDPSTGKVRKREDGKILKGPDWQPPKLDQFLTNISE